MRSCVHYGSTEIVFQHIISKNLKNAYLTVDAEEGVVLKSPQIPLEQAQSIVLDKGAWVLKKLKLVGQPLREAIVSGSRLPYLGRHYYTEVVTDAGVSKAEIGFTHSKFRIKVNPTLEDRQAAIAEKLNQFYLKKAKEKLAPRIKKRGLELGLKPSGVTFRRLSKRWGSCTSENRLVINSELVKLSWSLIDYVVVHELVHIEHKNHSKAFWNRVEDLMPDYQALHDQLDFFKM